jgi:hypothetical protein
MHACVCVCVCAVQNTHFYPISESGFEICTKMEDDVSVAHIGHIRPMMVRDNFSNSSSKSLSVNMLWVHVCVLVNLL